MYGVLKINVGILVKKTPILKSSSVFKINAK